MKATMAQITAAQTFCRDVVQARPPAPLEWLSERLAALLMHFFTGATGERLNAIVAADWMGILRPFPRDVVANAVTRWLETNTGKPRPAEIRDLCIQFYGFVAWENFERSMQISRMLPSAESTAASDNDGEWKKPTTEQMTATMTLMHNNGFHTGSGRSEKCPICAAEAKTYAD